MAKKKKKHSSAASEQHTESAESAILDAESQAAERASDADTAESVPQTITNTEATTAEEPIIITSVAHSTTVMDAAEEPSLIIVSNPSEVKLVAEPTEKTAEESAPIEPQEPAKEENKEQESKEAPAADTEALTEEEKADLRRDNAEFSMIDESKDNPYRNVFVQSLETVTADDLGTPPKKKKKDPVDVIIGLFRGAIFWAAVVAFFVSGYQIVSKLYYYQQSEDIYDFDKMFAQTERREDLVAMANKSVLLNTIPPVNAERSENASDAAQESEFNENLLIMKGRLQLLRNESKNVVGWIEMPGDTKVNYPIVQGEDNDYYLHYAYNDAYNPAGSIYLDYRNNVEVSTNRHTIIYGHNMESGTPMFANLLHYQDSSFWKNNRYIHIYTDEALYTYEVFAAYETSPMQAGVENHSWRMNFYKDENIFLKWVDSVKSRSDITPNVPIEGDGRILTLSTCMNINENRYVVHAVLVEVSK